MKCDLHVYTIHSGRCTVPVFKLAILARELEFAQRWERHITRIANAVPELGR